MMSTYFYTVLREAGLSAKKDELMLWEMMHELGVESLTALLEMDQAEIFKAVTIELPEFDHAA